MVSNNKPADTTSWTSSGVKMSSVRVILLLLAIQQSLAEPSKAKDGPKLVSEFDVSKIDEDGGPSPRRPQVKFGTPDASTFAGRLFKYSMQNAFNGTVNYIKISYILDWMYYDVTTMTLYGVPDHSDIGHYYITVLGCSQPCTSGNEGPQAKDIFALEVKPFSTERYNRSCGKHQDLTRAHLVLDANYKSLDPRQKVELLVKFALFMQKDVDIFTLVQSHKNVMDHDDDKIAGLGNANRNSKNTGTEIYWMIGCEGTEEEKVIEILSRGILEISSELGYDIQRWYMSVPDLRQIKV